MESRAELLGRRLRGEDISVAAELKLLEFYPRE
jgi:hypothetical protein